MGCCGKQTGPPRRGPSRIRNADLQRRSAIGQSRERGFRGLTAREAARGAVEIAKVSSGIGVVGREEAARRIKICAACPEMVEESAGPVVWWGCSKCHCILKFKTMSGSQHCPLGHW